MVSETVALLGELLSRGSNLGPSYSLDQAEAAPLAAVLEVKVSVWLCPEFSFENLISERMFHFQVETALITNDHSNSGFLLIVICGTAAAALCLGALSTLFWRHRVLEGRGSGVHLSPSGDISRHDEEKSNNLQNEENFRRYTNPLKGSASSLSGAMELSMHPAPDVVSVISLGEGSSSSHRVQSPFPCDTDFDKDLDKSKTNRGSQILLYKAQNLDMRKNTVGSIESPHKDFGKRSINNCKPLPAVLDSDVQTVHV